MASAPTDDDERPVLRSFTGSWQLDASKSESIEKLFAAMQVGWLARKVVGSLRIDANIFQTKEALILTEQSFLGTFMISLVQDGKWRPVVQIDKNTAPMRCTVDGGTGDIKIETRFPTGVLVDRRALTSRTVFRQKMSFQPASADATAPTTITRVFVRQETPEEAAAAEEAESTARVVLAHQAATMGLLSGATHVMVVQQQPPSAAPAVDAAASFEASAEGGAAESAAGGDPLLPAAPPTAAVTATTSDVPADAFPAPAVPVCDFSGSWVLDRARSDTLDGMLTLMGVPWLARKIANSLDITAVMRHDVGGRSLVAEDHSSLGLTVNTYTLDAVARTVASKDGKESTVTSLVLPVPYPVVPLSTPWVAGQAAAAAADPTAGAFGCVRIDSVLPAGAGETVDTRCLVEGGRVMRQLLVYSKGGKMSTTLRYLVNKAFDEAAFQRSLRRIEAHYAAGPAAVTAGAPAADGVEAAASAPAAPPPADDNAAEPAAGLTPVLPPSPSSSMGSAGSRRAPAAATNPAAAAPAGPAPLDPFFVSMTGVWSVDASRSDSLDPLWRSMGVGWLARALVGAFDITHAITHTRAGFRVEDRSSLGAHAQAVALALPGDPPLSRGAAGGGGWEPVKQVGGRYSLMRARQTSGAGDGGPYWLGDDVGVVPCAWVQAAAAAKAKAAAAPRDDEAEEDVFASSSSDEATAPSAGGATAAASTDSAPATQQQQQRRVAARAALELAEVEGSLAPEARGPDVELRRLPVRVEPFTVAEVALETALQDAAPGPGPQLEALVRQREAWLAALQLPTHPLPPPPAAKEDLAAGGGGGGVRVAQAPLMPGALTNAAAAEEERRWRAALRARAERRQARRQARDRRALLRRRGESAAAAGTFDDDDEEEEDEEEEESVAARGSNRAVRSAPADAAAVVMAATPTASAAAAAAAASPLHAMSTAATKLPPSLSGVGGKPGASSPSPSLAAASSSSTGAATGSVAAEWDDGTVASDPLAATVAGVGRLLVRYRMARRDELEVSYTHMSPAGTPILCVRRTLLRRETPEARAGAEVADAARIQHACTLIVARRGAADEAKAAYAARVAARRRQRAARRAAAAEALRRRAKAVGNAAAVSAATAASGRRGSGGASGGSAGSAATSEPVASVALARDAAARSFGSDDQEADGMWDDDSLADGVQCAVI